MTRPVVSGEDVAPALCRGVAVLERALGPTLGIGGSHVAIARSHRPGRPPELLRDGAVIARRITGLEDPSENVGLMLARHLAWTVGKAGQDNGGDAVVIAAELTRRLVRHLAGAPLGDWSRTATALRRLSSIAIEHVDGLARPADVTERAAMVRSIVPDDQLAGVLHEALSLLRPDIPVDIRSSRVDRSSAEYVEGATWQTTRLSGLERVPVDVVDAPRILLWDGPLGDAAPLTRALSRWSLGSSLVIVSRTLEGSARALIELNDRPDRRLVTVRVPGEGRSRDWALHDMAVITGAQLAGPERGDRLAELDEGSLGRSPRITVARDGVTVLHDPEASSVAPELADRLAASQVDGMTESDRREIDLRIGRLRGGLGIIRVGAPTDSQRDDLVAAADRAIGRVRGAMRHGTVPGAGASYAAAAGALGFDALAPDNMTMVSVLGGALIAPLRWRHRNLALRSTSLIDAWTLVPERGLDAAGAVIDLRAVGMVDPTSTVTGAITAAVSLATMIASSSVLVLDPDADLLEAGLDP